MKRFRVLAALFVLLALTATACSDWNDEKKLVGFDQKGCLFEYRNGQFGKLKRQLEPGSDTIKIGDHEELVTVPTSNRFYMISEDRSIGDPGAPFYVVGTDRDGVPLKVQMQARFVFNRELICDWLAQHGLRNRDSSGNLQFNDPGSDDAPCHGERRCWAAWLNENFGVGLKRSVQSGTSLVSRLQAKNNWDVNADSNGKLTGEPGGPVREVMEKSIGRAFTEYLNTNLGKQYFCGPGYDPAKPDACPDITVEISAVNAVDTKLEEADNAIANQQQQADQADQQQSASERRLASKRAELEVANLQAQIDNAKTTQFCRELAAIGVNCADYLAAEKGQVPGGTNITVNPPNG